MPTKALFQRSPGHLKFHNSTLASITPLLHLHSPFLHWVQFKFKYRPPSCSRVLEALPESLLFSFEIAHLSANPLSSDSKMHHECNSAVTNYSSRIHHHMFAWTPYNSFQLGCSPSPTVLECNHRMLARGCSTKPNSDGSLAFSNI